MNESERPSWKFPPIGAALLASVIGMFSCFGTLRWEATNLDSSALTESFGSNFSRFVALAAPIVVGTVVIAVVYRLVVERNPPARAEQPAESRPAIERPARVPPRSRPFDPPPTTDGPGAGFVFAVIVALSAAIAGMIAGLLTFSGGGAVTAGEVVSNVLFGMMFGGALGLVLAIPAALAIGFSNRNRPN